MDSAGRAGSSPDQAYLPLTERILDRLGRPRSFWIALWSLVPLASPLVFIGAIRATGQSLSAAEITDLLATQAVLAYACLIFLWGGGLLGERARSLREHLHQIAPAVARSDLFRTIGRRAGPLLLTATVAAIITAGGWLRYGPLPPLAALPLLLIYLFPILGFLWAYVSILVDINRLGALPLALDVFPQDRTLGLAKIGGLAGSGLGLVLIAALPVLLAGSDEPVTFGISLAIVALTIGAFILSVWRLHRQMVVAKARYVSLARGLYADAYAPIRKEPSVERMAKQASALQIAQSLEARAHDVVTWPFDDGTIRFMAVVVTGVVTSLVVRALFAAVGF
jgi:hypothetical protein